MNFIIKSNDSVIDFLSEISVFYVSSSSDEAKG